MLNRLKGFLYDTVLLLATLGPRKKSVPAILLVKTDEIGDYILWRRLLPEIVQAERFRGKAIHFCGNSSWKSLFDTFDRGLVSQSIWLD